MRFGWLIPVVLLVVVVATVVGWMLARRAGERSGKKGWVANTGFLRDLPAVQYFDDKQNVIVGNSTEDAAAKVRARLAALNE